MPIHRRRLEAIKFKWGTIALQSHEDEPKMRGCVCMLQVIHLNREHTLVQWTRP